MRSSIRVLFAVLALSCSAVACKKPCSVVGDCAPAPGDPDYCYQYTCDNVDSGVGVCRTWFDADGGGVTCGNAQCVEDSDCTSTPTVVTVCVSGACVGHLK